ncbi:alpha/beta fold hydrolase [Ornithinimicrobium cryptoxanthini]|uniref:Alpha/beta fold hydrolase n=1 Tax=Ornithinimicrobium cryptoxanthini TaxID=2934161 RepID=A0ABY4YMI3_9MICO|nr:alpha/beta fold hydrolase [Ornithinimicrobium cryptoxanthini]USQ77751.1 alpha/beta fold hydrolase [Ornithinimicrobium cryptoxanthini]
MAGLSDQTDTAVEPATTGVTVRDGVDLAWQTYGTGPRTLLLLPTWQIFDSRFWKAQVGYLSRHFRVVTFDGRGTGASGRPTGASAYSNDECAADVTAVLNATGTERAVLVALSCAASWAIQTAADHPDRVDGVFALSPSCGVSVSQPVRDAHAFDERLDPTQGWAKYNRYYWTEGDFADFRDFFFHQMFTEPHSTKQLEDALRWSEQTDPQTLVDANLGRLGCDGVVCRSIDEAAQRVTCPVLVVHGTDDRVRSDAVGRRIAELTGGRLVLIEGGGHGLMSRSPVQINRLIHEFATSACAPVIGSTDRPTEPTTWTFAPSRRRRVLYLSSPIGLGHAARDLAVVQELRRLEPDIEVDWLAQHPVTRVLEAAGERVHPASAWLASESTHVEHESGEHDLHAFQAIRRMDAILVHNFMVFQDLVADEHYDLVVGDEAWDVDYFLHENPELKTFNFAWMTDFVGWLPMPDGGPEEAALTADYNAEMIEQRARFARVRDRSIFVGSPEDVVPDSFGDGLPQIPDWMGKNFDFAGYVTGFDPAALPDRAELRHQLGMPQDERVCVVTVGGTGVGRPLLERVLDAVPLARRAAPDLRFIVVTGPRIDPRSLPRRRGVNVRGFLPDLYRHLAASDLAVVQGGLTTCMELTAGRRPFVYVPLRHHFEQNFHVRHRLERYGAGRHLPYEEAADPDALAAAVLTELDRVVDYRPVETDGAARAAAMLADLL